MNTAIFIRQSKQLYGENMYFYDNAKYINDATKIKIICPLHGNFELTYQEHIILNNGCRSCNLSRP